MTSRQYTIRNISPVLDREIREEAKRSGKSLNEVVLETLESAKLHGTDKVYDDLDWFIGDGTLDASFDRAIEWLDSAPKTIK